MSGLPRLVSQRKVVRKRVTDCFNRKHTFSSLSQDDKASEKEILLGFKEILLDLDNQIFALKFSGTTEESEIDTETETCQQYLDKIRSCLPLLANATQSASSNNPQDQARSLLKQPTAPLPKFHGREGEDLIKFLTEFELTTGVYNYPDRDLLLLLRQQVEGRASYLLQSLELDKQSYQDAKQLLTNAFATTEVRKSSTIKKLLELKLRDTDDPYLFISNLRAITESVEKLKIDSKEFLRFFAWNALNDEFRKVLV